ncbi:UDP-N-acetylglucosamine 2-epimerase [Butyrivibrio sp. AE2032]|uniref:UDP-N-acetylglucosamine 2-epimerase n=1 Tax=Butyrivibrio sp. AE2032 TaxID=1458463 RepID=UPI000553C185|nr:UDP-N-acetylglucosamine 2-epimerase [Butyrivibrio sp. AE2032]
MKRIAVVTATRAEYGLLKWLMREIENSHYFELQLVVTGAHLLESQGHTIDQILADGFVPSEVVDVALDNDSLETIATTLGRMTEQFAHTWARLKPDYVVVLGDRYELFPIVNTAFLMRIPIIHISGGDVTEGAIDDGVRNAVTMIADYHFPGTKDSAVNISRMRGSDRYVWAVGEPGLDNFIKEKLMTREELANDLGINMEKKWVLLTYHPETKQSLEYNITTVENIVDSLQSLDNIQVVATYSNADYGGVSINKFLEEKAIEKPCVFKVIPSLGRRYLSFMRQAKLVIGNSSSGIVEAPFMGIPVVNVGERQRGRHICSNVIQAGADRSSINEALDKAFSMQNVEKDYYWGDGHTAEKIINILNEELA